MPEVGAVGDLTEVDAAEGGPASAPRWVRSGRRTRPPIRGHRENAVASRAPQMRRDVDEKGRPDDHDSPPLR